MSFSDSDWTRDPPVRPSRPRLQQRVWTLALAIAAASIGLAMAYYGVERMLEAAPQSTMQRKDGDLLGNVPAPGSGPAPSAVATTTAASTSAPTPVVIALPAVPTPVPVPASTTPSSEPKPATPEQLAALEAEMRQRVREAAQQAAAEAAQRKERAWERYYQRPDFCNGNPTSAQMVQCANHHIRARREFEERYSTPRSP